MAPKLPTFVLQSPPPARPRLASRTAFARRPRANAAAVTGETTIVETLRDHFERVAPADVHVARLRTALNFYVAAPRIQAFRQPADVAGAFQNAHWRLKCYQLMRDAAANCPKNSRSFELLQGGQFAMRLDQRLPEPDDAAQAFFSPEPGPRFMRDAVPALDVFKTEVAALELAKFDLPTCNWLHTVSRMISLFERSQVEVEKEDLATFDIDLDTLSIAAYALHDVLESPDRPDHAALGSPKNFERARQALVDMCNLRLDEISELLD